MSTDQFEALGMGADLYDYRGPYEQCLGDDHAKKKLAASADLPQLYRQAAAAIGNADYLIIGAGAGMGVDSGLAAYADVAAVPAWAERGHTYATLCQPSLLDEDPALFYGFWGNCANNYRDAAPHEGYRILRRWCTDVLPQPTAAGGDGDGAAPPPLSNSWVYTSNVDGHFLASGVPADCLLELHGGCTGAKGWFCRECAAPAAPDPAPAPAPAPLPSPAPAPTTATATAPPVHPALPAATSLLHACAVALPEDYRFPIDAGTMTLDDDSGGSPGGSVDGATATVGPDLADGGKKDLGTDAGGFRGGWPRCNKAGCVGLLRPAVHMFNESDHSLLAHLKAEEARYVEWECRMENAVFGFTADEQNGTSPTPATDGGGGDGGGGGGGGGGARTGPRLVLLEVGCGMTVPSIRMEMECVLRDVKAEKDANVTMIRINNDYVAAQNPLYEESTISIVASAADALQGIDNALRGAAKK